MVEPVPVHNIDDDDDDCICLTCPCLYSSVT